MLMLAAVVVAGSFLRLAPMLGTDFPLNDGALFLTMAEDLRANGFALPISSTYNDLGMPFAYPPAGLYLTAFMESAGMSGIDVLRLVPVLASIATIPLVYAIGREVFGTPHMALATAALFAVSTGSYEWLVLGGGITRAPGFFLALVAVLLAIRAYRRDGWSRSIACGAALGATGLWHPQAAVFAALSVLLLLPFVAGDRRRAIRSLLVIGATAVVVVIPWLSVVVARHGPDPFLSAGGTGGTPLIGIVSVLSARTSAGHFEVLGIATTVALVVSVLRGFWLPAIWMVAIVIVDSRAGQPYISVPAALAIAFLLRDISSVLGRQSAAPTSGGRWPRIGRLAPITIGVVLFMASFADSLLAQTRPDSPLQAVPRAERDAMAWVSANTPADASFVVVSGRYWALDAPSEWFPVLADRRSVATVQGYEWLGAQQFERQQERAGALAPCIAASDVECVERWIDQAEGVDYLFLTRSQEAAAAGLECCHQLADQLDAVRTTTVVYQDGAVIIAELPSDPEPAP